MEKPDLQQTINGPETNDMAPEVIVDRFSDQGWARTSAHVPGEMELTIYINDQELVTILCTPTRLTPLVLGFLLSEGIIKELSDVASARICHEDSLADVKLNDIEFKMPTKRTLTSGCGGGATFTAQVQKVDSSLVVTPAEVLDLMKQLQEKEELYRLSGGVHASALADSKKLLVVAEDIGRHNTLDKILGECLLRKQSTSDCLLLSTGRLSSEMVRKAARMQVPVVVSRSSPTSRAISLGRELGITLVGYARGSHLTVYSHPERLGRASQG